MKQPTKFTVEGCYPFPVDMLRYDCCYPATSEDAVQLAESLAFGRRIRGDVKRRRQVTLVTNSVGKPTVGRWKSFDWDVL